MISSCMQILSRSARRRAAERGHTEVVKLLLANGAEVNLSDNDGRTLLSRATANGRKAVKELLERGNRIFSYS